MSGEATEQVPQLEVKRLDKATFKQYETQIMGLGKNALDAHEGTGFAERENDVKDLFEKYFGSTNRGEMFVAVKNDAVLAFVALKKVLSPEKEVEIEQLRFATGLYKPKHVIAEVLHAVKASLEKEDFHHAMITTDGERHKLSSFEKASWFEKFFETADSTTEDNLEIQG